jgi:hypothetical protein
MWSGRCERTLRRIGGTRPWADQRLGCSRSARRQARSRSEVTGGVMARFVAATKSVLLSVAVVLAALVVPAVGASGAAAAPQLVDQPVQTFVVQLEPTSVDSDASGTAVVIVNAVTGTLCYTIVTMGLDEPVTAAHLHTVSGIDLTGTDVGPGGIVVGLTAVQNGISRGCVPISQELALEIIGNPDNFYVNVHGTNLVSVLSGVLD